MANGPDNNGRQAYNPEITQKSPQLQIMLNVSQCPMPKQPKLAKVGAKVAKVGAE